MMRKKAGAQNLDFQKFEKEGEELIFLLKKGIYQKWEKNPCSGNRKNLETSNMNKMKMHLNK